MPTIIRLEAIALPRKTYDLNVAALRDLATIQEISPMTETAAIHLALRNLAEMLDRGFPVYVTKVAKMIATNVTSSNVATFALSLPEGPQPPTSAPPVARPKPPRVVENQRKRGVSPPAPRPSNTKRGKK